MMSGSGKLQSSVLMDLDKDWASFLRSYKNEGGGLSALPNRGSDPTASRPSSSHSDRPSEARRLDFAASLDDTASSGVPAKRRKTPDASEDERLRERELEVLAAKTEAAKLSSELRTLRRESAEEKAALRRQLTATTAQSERLESRVTGLQKEMEWLAASERSAAEEAASVRQELAEVRLWASESAAGSSQRRRESLEAAAADTERVEEALRAAEDELHTAKMALEAEQSARRSAEVEAQAAGEAQRRLSEQLLEATTAKSEAGNQIAALEEEVRRLREDGELSVALRQDLAELAKLRKDTETAQSAALLFKARAENTALLKEKLNSAEAANQQLRSAMEERTRENNALKMAVAKAGEWKQSMKDVDLLTFNLSQLTEANKDLESKLAAAAAAVPSQTGAETETTEDRIWHMPDNPLDSGHAALVAQLRACQEQQSSGMSGGVSGGVRGGGGEGESEETAELVGRVARLERELAAAAEKRERVKKAFRETGAAYRDTSVRLTGLQIKMKEEGGGATVFEVGSCFEPAADRIFVFRREEGGEIQLMGTEYTARWTDLIEMYLHNDACIPAFLAAVTLHLYNQEDSDSNATLMPGPSS